MKESSLAHILRNDLDDQLELYPYKRERPKDKAKEKKFNKTGPIRMLRATPLSETLEKSREIFSPQFLNASKYILQMQRARQKDLSAKYQEMLMNQDAALRQRFEPAIHWNRPDSYSFQNDQSMNLEQSSFVEKCTIDKSKKYVLLVDDNAFGIGSIAAILSVLKYEVTIAKDGKQGVELFHSHVKEGVLFHLILMDLIMPVMNGYDATAEIRHLENTMNFSHADRHYICGISGEVNDGIEKRCRNCGMDNIISKPIKKDMVEDLLKLNENRSNILGGNVERVERVRNVLHMNELTILD
eukprot:CAMPEP_0170544054 /NCGR_PEP_ID=MMETSP0211-20121228/2951_1 /TAXON_ID=311385 /ORGANISM="Pseudokeronopsis sp., Strain OXSARD2" /LENGTH=298 /DNA_ID=CAMNT_0010847595 /DNA_START=2833 /DNA_END=3729 /DNA_ORIENTATION=+